MEFALLPVLLMAAATTALGVGLLSVGGLLGPKKDQAIKRMPYESGMDPVHDAHRKFDVRFHLVAIAFLVFDVELLFLYPWAVASRQPEGIAAAVTQAQEAGFGLTRGLIFAEVLVFLGILALGLVYAWRRGVFRWR